MPFTAERDQAKPIESGRCVQNVKPVYSDSELPARLSWTRLDALLQIAAEHSSAGSPLDNLFRDWEKLSVFSQNGTTNAVCSCCVLPTARIEYATPHRVRSPRLMGPTSTPVDIARVALDDGELNRARQIVPTNGNASAPAMTLSPSTAPPTTDPPTASRKRAVVLLSGGLDSTTTLAIAREQGYQLHAITFRYGQRHAQEVDLAKQIAEQYGVVRHAVVDVDLRQFGGSALTADLEVPKGTSVESIGTDVPITYVPARNTIFLSFALAFAEVADARDLFIGVNSLDYSGYPDCRPEFIAAFEQLANLATKTGTETDGFTIHAPLIQMTKAQIIRRGIGLGVDYSLTTSCYDPSTIGRACGHCDACLLRRKGFSDNDLTDPIDYA